MPLNYFAREYPQPGSTSTSSYQPGKGSTVLTSVPSPGSEKMIFLRQSRFFCLFTIKLREPLLKKILNVRGYFSYKSSI